MRHEYLLALHESGSAVADTGWEPRYVTLHRGNLLLGAAPLYAKHHSFGEYVFDWSWAQAYQRHGLDYYPKALCAIPFTPVPGTRLLAAGDAERMALIDALRAFTRDQGLSSAHALFLDDAERDAFAHAGWIIRRNVQFHWRRGPHAGFAEFLTGLQRDKRKKIQQERRRVADAGVRFTVHEGPRIDASLWRFFHACYRETYRQHHSAPYLNPDFFDRMSATMAEHWLMFVAHRDGERIACSLVAIDRARSHAWGRYWGALEHVPCLHFEACYYQPLQWCLANGMQRFEGGAQGEHKMARGLMPVPTWSAHWVAEPRLGQAIAAAVARESEGVSQYTDELREHSPFKAQG